MDSCRPCQVSKMPLQIKRDAALADLRGPFFIFSLSFGNFGSKIRLALPPRNPGSTTAKYYSKLVVN